MSKNAIKTLAGKIEISVKLLIKSGMHIGGNDMGSTIGAVDSPIVRDSLTKEPIIPGSSLKGKLRILLSRFLGDGVALNNPNEDPEIVKRLFGASSPVQLSRLQFIDAFLTEDSRNEIRKMNTDLYLSEIKFENSINRLTAVANPRQIERVPAGAEFDVKIIYNVESLDEVKEDMQALKQALQLLEYDYIGGHGSRGSGHIACKDMHAKVVVTRVDSIDIEEVNKILC